MAQPKGYIVYEGPSVLDGAPIVVVATMASSNIKTGPKGKNNMVQTWIIRSDVDPLEASRGGLDSSVCGQCIHRPTLGNTCYVTLFQAPLGIYKGYKRGLYSRDYQGFLGALSGRLVRLGAYGDPAAVPLEIWEEVTRASRGHTGYTHQRAHPQFNKGLLDFVMVSVDTPEDAQALEPQERYFRVKRPLDPALEGEVECLSDSVGKTCAECLLCDGMSRGKGKSVYINVHGAKAPNFNPLGSTPRGDIIAMAA